MAAAPYSLARHLLSQPPVCDKHTCFHAGPDVRILLPIRRTKMTTIELIWDQLGAEMQYRSIVAYRSLNRCAAHSGGLDKGTVPFDSCVTGPLLVEGVHELQLTTSIRETLRAIVSDGGMLLQEYSNEMHVA
jgi:hypothetical protein